MSDGPFKNLNLSRRWQRFVNAIQNSATDRSECADLASDACLREILTSGDTEALLKDLVQHSLIKQIDFEQAAFVERIFGSHSQTPFSEVLQTEILYHLECGLSLNRALDKGLDASVDKYIGIVKTRIEEEIIRVAHEKEIKRSAAARAIGLASSSLRSIDQSNLSHALITSNKNAFRSLVSRSSGLDEGPAL